MTSKDITLLDEILPVFDVAAKYSIRIGAPPEEIFRILQNGIPAGLVTRLLMTLRKLPRFFQKHPSVEYPFYKLKQSQDREIVVGIIGQFWKPVANIVEIHGLEEFLSFERKGYCKAALNLRILGQQNGTSLLSTETRVVSYGYAKVKFESYWNVIRPFSGLIRKEMLRKVKKQVESVVS
jgi:hypothetical protein